MRFAPLLVLGSLSILPAARAVYAPIPESEQGKALTFTARGGVSHDSNIFGAQTAEIESTIFTLSPKVALNASLTPQTFLSTFYQLTVEHFDNRPGDKTLESHQAMVRLSHKLADGMVFDITDIYSSQRNPASLLAGVPLNSDQSVKNNQLNVIFSFPVGPKVAVDLKGRSASFRFKSPALSTSLDRTENVYAASAGYAVLPELKVLGEFRHQTVEYRTGGGTKDKKSDFALVGADYQMAEKLSAGARAGVEDRRRQSEPDFTAPYFELNGRYNYAEGSYISGGGIVTVEEASDVALYTDTLVRRFFVNVQHAISPRIIASGAVNYEPSRLNARSGSGVGNLDEQRYQLGAALSWRPTEALVVSGTLDWDDVDSGTLSRESTRTRFGVTAAFTF